MIKYNIYNFLLDSFKHKLDIHDTLRIQSMFNLRFTFLFKLSDSYFLLQSRDLSNSLNHCEMYFSANKRNITDSIRDKILQPFFIIKPTGLGTGLGLSLAYDIVKAHGGELKEKVPCLSSIYLFLK